MKYLVNDFFKYLIAETKIGLGQNYRIPSEDKMHKQWLARQAW